MLRALILTPFLLLLVAFALSNPQTVTLGLWPTDLTIDAPVSIATLVIAGVFFLLGAVIVWIPSLRHRRRARVAERRATSLANELAVHKKAAVVDPRNPVPLLAPPR